MTTLFRLREVMEALTPALSLRQVALRAGLGYTTAHAIYHNHTTRVDLATLDKLAAALGVPPGDLVGSTKPASTPRKARR